MTARTLETGARFSHYLAGQLPRIVRRTHPTRAMKFIHLLKTAVVLPLICIQSSLAALQVGDPAPAIQTGEWIQGTPVDNFEGDKVYIIEFWATWCGPCVAAIPHINELHQQYKDQGLVVIGQNVWERNIAGVKPFLGKMGNKMTYRVAMDDTSDGSRGTMVNHWLKAAGKTGIPCAFVVNKKGNVAYIGHPMAIENSLLEELLAEPSTNSAAAGTETQAEPLPAETLALVSQTKQELLAGEFDKAEAGISKLQNTLPAEHRDIGALLYLDLLLARKKNNDALFLSEMMAEDFKNSPATLCDIADRLSKPPGAPSGQLDAAANIAATAAEKEGSQQWQAFAIQARVASLKNNKSGAIALQTKAVALAPEKHAILARKTLLSYQGSPAPETPAQ